MSDSWKDMGKAKEDSYFDKMNKEALARLQARASASRKSPINGNPMEQITSHGLVIDRCKESGGIWLDFEEVKRAHDEAKAGNSAWLGSFFESLLKK